MQRATNVIITGMRDCFELPRDAVIHLKNLQLTDDQIEKIRY